MKARNPVISLASGLSLVLSLHSCWQPAGRWCGKLTCGLHGLLQMLLRAAYQRLAGRSWAGLASMQPAAFCLVALLISVFVLVAGSLELWVCLHSALRWLPLILWNMDEVNRAGCGVRNIVICWCPPPTISSQRENFFVSSPRGPWSSSFQAFVKLGAATPAW